jgi:hypothetical protein
MTERWFDVVVSLMMADAVVVEVDYTTPTPSGAKTVRERKHQQWHLRSPARRHLRRRGVAGPTTDDEHRSSFVGPGSPAHFISAPD